MRACAVWGLPGPLRGGPPTGSSAWLSPYAYRETTSTYTGFSRPILQGLRSSGEDFLSLTPDLLRIDPLCISLSLSVYLRGDFPTPSLPCFEGGPYLLVSRAFPQCRSRCHLFASSRPRGLIKGLEKTGGTSITRTRALRGSCCCCCAAES